MMKPLKFYLKYIHIVDFNKAIKWSEEDLCVLLLDDLQYVVLTEKKQGAEKFYRND